jgi:hypothetical protein
MQTAGSSTDDAVVIVAARRTHGSVHAFDDVCAALGSRFGVSTAVHALARAPSPPHRRPPLTAAGSVLDVPALI